MTVLDIGTGTGILAVMSARAGASHVFACEVNGVLCDVAKEVLERLGTNAEKMVTITVGGCCLPASVRGQQFFKTRCDGIKNIHVRSFSTPSGRCAVRNHRVGDLNPIPVEN